MTKSTIWKLIFILGILLVCYKLISPFEDRELGEYAESQAGTTADPAQYPDHVSSQTHRGIRPVWRRPAHRFRKSPELW